MPHRIEIGLKNHVRDALGEKLKRRIRDDLNLEVQSVNTISVYTIDADLSTSNWKRWPVASSQIPSSKSTPSIARSPNPSIGSSR